MTIQQLAKRGYRLSLTIEQMEDGSYMATSSDLPGFLVLADSVDGVVRLAPDVAKSLIEAMQEKGVQPGLTSEELQFPMFEIAKMTSDNRLQLPDKIAGRFLPSDQFIVWIEDDTIHLKRITPSPLKMVEQAPEDEPISLDEINEIVHEVRSQRHKREAE